MATRDTTTPASTPPSPSPRADAAPSDSETPGRSPDVVDITGGEEPWTASAARSTSDPPPPPPPLRASKRAAARTATSTVSVEARKGKKKASGRASTAASVSSSSKKGSEDSGSTGPTKRAEDAGVETNPDAEEKVALPRAKRAKKSPAPAPSPTARTPAPAKTAEASCNDRGGFYLNKFMASFEPSRAVPERREAAALPTATPAQASFRHDSSAEVTETDVEPVMAELRALREEISRLRMLQGQGEPRWGPAASAPLLEVPTSAGTAPNTKGELPPPEVRFLTCGSFPEISKKSKGEYNPPQAHLLAASRMFRGLGLEPGKMKSPMSFVLMLRELECVKFKTSPAVLMAVFSGRLGSRGLTVMHFKEASEMSCLEDGSTNVNFSSGFSPSATLPGSTIQCSSYDDILDGIHGLNALGQEVWFDYMRKLASRLRTFVCKNNLRVAHSPTFKRMTRCGGPISASLRSIEYQSAAWTMALVNVATQAHEDESR
ncbi:hypothetical protein L916_00741 [Phytophthora nicotianae]|uniref:Uncharacterized protein n=1 Tax=Phytophthora nicotianae TaxID=4792 RepID=W2JUB3_PHYNI|nr:hypothetical protein L916_00741 [Phytophthora nicotianae]